MEKLSIEQSEHVTQLANHLKIVFKHWNDNFPTLKNVETVFTLEAYMDELNSKCI